MPEPPDTGSAAAASHRLVAIAHEPPSSTTFRFEPANPVSSIGGNASSLLGLFGLPPGASDPEFVRRAVRSDEIMPPGGYDVRGHRIRLDVSSSNFPPFDVNPNTGEPIGRERRRIAADNTVHHEAGRASRLTLPIIP